MIKETYPSGYYTLNHYDNNGYLYKITDQSSRNIWEAVAENARGQLTEEKKGGNSDYYYYYYYDNRGLPDNTYGMINLEYEFDSKGNLVTVKITIWANTNI